MNDVPENQLVSAYLDGELTAAEQAEVERLLAARPAARQLLEELRALRSKLQGLPQQKLGEDLSATVLRVAQQRILASSRPGDRRARPEELPKPAGAGQRPPLNRLIGPRPLARFAVAAAAVAVLVLVVPGRQPRPDVDRLVARAPEKVEPPRSGLSIEPDAGKAGPEDHLADLRAGDSSGETLDTPEPGPGVAAGGYTPEDRRPEYAQTGVRGKSAPGTVAGSGPITHAVEAKQGEPIARRLGRSPPVEWDVLVQCRISPEAHQHRAFVQALADNGIVWGDPRASTEVFGGNAAAAQGQVRESLRPPKRQHAPEPAEEGAPAERVDLVYVEAPRAQIKGVLTALQAQPDAFSPVSWEPTGQARAAKGAGRPAVGEAWELPTLPSEGHSGVLANGRTGGQAPSQEAEAAGRSHSYRAVAPAVEQPVARPKQPQEGQDRSEPRAYARRIRLSTAGVAFGAKSRGRETELLNSVLLALRSSQPARVEPPAPKAAPKGLGQPAQRPLRERKGPGAEGATAAQSAFDGQNQPMRQRPAAPAGRGPEAQPTLEPLPPHREPPGSDAQAATVRALFVLHVAELNRRATSIEEPPRAAKGAPEDGKAGPPPPTQK